MIVTCLRGGLGNQMFQYAAARCLSIQKQTELQVELDELFRFSRRYGLGKFCIQAGRISKKDADSLPLIREEALQGGTLQASCGSNACLQGYWQQEYYFAGYSDILRQDFRLSNSLGDSARCLAKQIRGDAQSVSVHIRRGDYFHQLLVYENFGLCGLSYYQQCVEKLAERYGNLSLYIFSDDIDWAKEYFHPGYPVIYVSAQVNDEAEELYLMSLCRMHIISNSTFAWWGAWLDERPERVVLMPDPWTRTGAKGPATLEEWICIPSESAWTEPEKMDICTVYVQLKTGKHKAALQSFLTLMEPPVKEWQWHASVENFMKLLDEIVKAERQGDFALYLLKQAVLEGVHRIMHEQITYGEAVQLRPRMLSLCGETSAMKTKLSLDFCEMCLLLARMGAQNHRWCEVQVSLEGIRQLGGWQGNSEVAALAELVQKNKIKEN